MWLEAVQNYVGARLLLKFEAGQLTRLLTAVFLLSFAGAVLIDVLVRPQIGIVHLLLHGSVIALTYVASVALAAAVTLLPLNLTQRLRVWHVWGISLAGFVMG